MNKWLKGMGSSIFRSKQNVAPSKWHYLTILLMSKVRTCLGLCKVVPLPSNIVEDNVVKDQSCWWVEHYPFCGLGFEPLWARQIASCKHVYHAWCAHVHFQMSIKCIETLCGEKMHDGWWLANGIQKPRSEPQLQ
jgi:hypothetical protein